MTDAQIDEVAEEIDYPISPRGDGNAAAPSDATTSPFEIDYPISPRGDGNDTVTYLVSRIVHSIDYPISPRGDGNAFFFKPYAGFNVILITPFPREGTETSPQVLAFRAC